MSVMAMLRQLRVTVGFGGRLRCYADALSACLPSPLRMCDRE
jgi:hypothetical protein